MNCVNTNIREIPAFRQLEMGMSTNLYFPAMGTAGLERLAVNGYKRVPAPPPRITETISLAMVFELDYVICLYRSMYLPTLVSQLKSNDIIRLRRSCSKGRS